MQAMITVHVTCTVNTDTVVYPMHTCMYWCHACIHACIHILVSCMQRLEASEAEKKRMGEAEQKRKEELGKLRTSLSSGKLVGVLTTPINAHVM